MSGSFFNMILYKYSTKEIAQQWEIVVDGNGFYTIEGQVGGKLTTSEKTICLGKNIGKSNETSPEEQAIAEAKSRFQKKIDKGYNQFLTKEKKFFEPMLAKNYQEYKKLLFTVPTYIQVKLDGLRAINQNNTLFSRNGKEYLTCPHLYQNDILLDGELYNHDYKDNFNKIVSLCKKSKPDTVDIEEAGQLIQYWVYDFPAHAGVFSERYAALEQYILNTNNTSFVLVPTFRVNSEEEIEKYHTQFLENGFEGSIIRLDLGEYENKRSKQLLKKKDFQDAEFEIVDVIEGIGNRSGTAGNLVIKLSDNKTCSTNIKGDFNYLTELLFNKNQLIGKMATVKFFNYTPDGVPRFPFVIKIDRDSHE